MKKEKYVFLFFLIIMLAFPLFSFEVPIVQANPSYEDFTTFTEIDTGADRIQKTANHIDHMAYRDEITYLYKDYGAAHFTDFVHFINIYSGFNVAQSIGFFWGLSNDLGDFKTLRTTLKDVLGVFTYPNTIKLWEATGGSSYSDTSVVLSSSTWYYLRIEKSGTAFICGIWSNSGDRDVNDTGAGSYVDGLSITLQSDYSFRYCYGCSSYNDGWSFYVNNDIENLDLNEAPANIAPVNDSCTITDMDDSDNLYAQISGGYSIDYDGHDDDGYVDIDYVLVNITQAATVRVSFKYTNSTNTFSIIDGSSEFTLDGSSSASRAGTNINLTIVFHVQWDATEESDVELKAVIADDEPSSDTDTMQTDYADVVTNLVVSGFSCDDDRGNLEQTITFTGTVYYANNPASSTATTFYPPDIEFTAVHIYDSGDNDKGNDNTVVNGAFSVSFSASASVSIETYNPYIDMADADYSDAEESPTDTFISDRIVAYWEQLDDNRVNTDSNIEWRIKAVLDYDDHTLGSEDGITSSWGALNWDAGNTWFEISHSESNVNTYTITLTVGSEATHTITSFSENITESSGIYDRIKILTLVADPTDPVIENYAKINATAELEYDHHALGSEDTLTIESLFLPWDSEVSEFNGKEKKDTPQSKTYNEGVGNEATYGITVVNMDGKNVTVTWGEADEDFTDPADIAVALVASLIFIPLLILIIFAARRKH